jgi:hypothetical protein
MSAGGLPGISDGLNRDSRSSGVNTDFLLRLMILCSEKGPEKPTQFRSTFKQSARRMPGRPLKNGLV